MEDELKKRAETGDLDAQLTLAFLCELGIDRPQDFSLAKKWWMAAAKLGSAWAQYRLAKIFASEDHGKVDPFAASQWAEKAKLAGFCGPHEHIAQFDDERQHSGRKIVFLAEASGSFRSLSQELETQGHEITFIAGSRELFARLADAPDTALVVIDMERGRAQENLQLIKALNHLNDTIKVLAISTSPVPREIRESKKVQLVGWLCKPVRAERFVAVVQRHVA